MKKKDREFVLSKTGGLCFYCGEDMRRSAEYQIAECLSELEDVEEELAATKLGER